MREIIRLGPQCREHFMDQQQFPELLDHGIWLAGLSDLKGLHHIERAFEGRMMLSFALEGGSWYRVGDQGGHWQAGQALFIRPQTPFTLQLDDGGFRRSAWVILERSPAWRALEKLPPCFVWPDGPRFARALEALNAESFLRSSHQLRRLLIGQCREYMLRIPLLQNGIHDSRLDDLLLEVSANLSHAWDLKSLCERAHMSRAQLHRRFMAEYGTSPMACVNNLRLQRAAVLLDTGSQAVARIGESVGFGNAFYFSTAFKEHFGVSPRAWRNGCRAPETDAEVQAGCSVIRP